MGFGVLDLKPQMRSPELKALEPASHFHLDRGKTALLPASLLGGFPKLGKTTIMENQMEKKMENEMETGII